MTLRTSPILALTAAAAVLAVAGCGSSDDTSGATGSATSSSSAGTGMYDNASSTAAVAAKAPAGAATIATKKTDLGTVLVDGKGRTIYLWVADKGSKSTCNGACAKAWPPVLTKGTPKATGKVNQAWLGTTKRRDGTTEVTYKGHPLYLFVGDKAPGDTNGQGSEGFGAYWWVVDPAGNAVTKGGDAS